MAIPAKVVIYGPDQKLLKGPSKIPDTETPDLSGSEIYEFNHHVWVNLSKASILNTWCDIRKHEPLQIVKSLDNISVFLYRFCLMEIVLPQVEIRWYEYQDGKKRDG